MGDFHDVFERTEKKYLLEADQHRRFMEKMEGRLGYDEFGRTEIRSLYYDAPEDVLANRSLEKPPYKEKLRIRSYGPASLDSIVFIEIKKKFKGIVYKRRIGCSYMAARAYMNDDVPYRRAIERFPLADREQRALSESAKALQISREVDFMKERYAILKPSMLIVTQRASYLSNEGSDIRMTFDHSARWSTASLSLDAITSESPLIEEGQRIMEIKCSKAFPLWLVEALNAVEARPFSISKYGRAYKAAHPIRAPKAAHEEGGPETAKPGAKPTGQPSSPARRRPLGAHAANGGAAHAASPAKASHARPSSQGPQGASMRETPSHRMRELFPDHIEPDGRAVPARIPSAGRIATAQLPFVPPASRGLDDGSPAQRPLAVGRRLAVDQEALDDLTGRLPRIGPSSDRSDGERRVFRAV